MQVRRIAVDELPGLIVNVRQKPACKAVHQLHRILAPDLLQGALAEVGTDIAQRRRLESFGHALGDPAVNSPLARTVFRPGLLHEHGHCHRRRILPLAVLRQQRAGLLQQLRSGERVGEIHPLEPLALAPDARLMWLSLESGTTISQGRPRILFAGCAVTTVYQSQPAFLRVFHSPTVTCSPRLASSKCHWPQTRSAPGTSHD